MDLVDGDTGGRDGLHLHALFRLREYCIPLILCLLFYDVLRSDLVGEGTRGRDDLLELGFDKWLFVAGAVGAGFFFFAWWIFAPGNIGRV